MRQFLIKNLRTSNPLLMLLLVLPVLHSCNQPKDFFSSEYRIAPPGFSVDGDTLWAAPSPVNFVSQKCTIKANFSHTVTWILKIKGTESGAVKQFTGLSQNLEQVWTGNHDGQYFFKAGETAAIELTFLGSNKTVLDTVLISGAKRNNTQGIILGNSASTEGFEGATNFNGPQWGFGIFSDGVAPAYEIDVERCGISGGTKRDPMNPVAGERPIQGNYALTLAGKDLNGDYYIGGMNSRLTPAQQASIPDDPKQVYVNIYIYGKGDGNARLNYKFTEHNGSVVDDVYQKEFTLSHKGWKLFSVKYADLDLVTRGNGISEPNKLSEIGFILISSPPGNTVEATFDMPSITFGAPFDPTK